MSRASSKLTYCPVCPLSSTAYSKLFKILPEYEELIERFALLLDKLD